MRAWQSRFYFRWKRSRVVLNSIKFLLSNWNIIFELQVESCGVLFGLIIISTSGLIITNKQTKNKRKQQTNETTWDIKQVEFFHHIKYKFLCHHNFCCCIVRRTKHWFHIILLLNKWIQLKNQKHVCGERQVQC